MGSWSRQSAFGCQEESKFDHFSTDRLTWLVFTRTRKCFKNILVLFVVVWWGHWLQQAWSWVPISVGMSTSWGECLNVLCARLQHFALLDCMLQEVDEIVTKLMFGPDNQSVKTLEKMLDSWSDRLKLTQVNLMLECWNLLNSNLVAMLFTSCWYLSCIGSHSRLKCQFSTCDEYCWN